jgi:hypothetical protein
MLRHPRVMLALLAMALSGQAFTQAPTGSPAASPDHSPDALFHAFGGGLWVNVHPISVEQMETIPQPLTPAYQAKKDEQTRNRAQGKEIMTTDNRCIPSGMPRMMFQASFEFISRPGNLGILTSGMQVRNIWLDGRKHTPIDELFDSFSGESIGHWEGDTLVVSTIGLRPTNEILYGVPGHYLTVDERFTKTGPDTLQVVTTVSDPVVFTKPWTYTINFKRNPKTSVNDTNYCVHAFDREVNKDGVEGFDLTPPPDPRDVK